MGKGFSLLDKLILVSIRHIITFFYNNKKNLLAFRHNLAAIFVQGQLEVKLVGHTLYFFALWGAERRQNSG